MWAEKGGLDFEGRARWDAWTAVKASAGSGLGVWAGRGECMHTAVLQEQDRGLPLSQRAPPRWPCVTCVTLAAGLWQADPKIDTISPPSRRA